jgi:hypothetical protein
MQSVRDNDYEKKKRSRDIESAMFRMPMRLFRMPIRRVLEC